jgi:WD40 repeat protein
LVLGDHFAYAVGSHLTILNRADGARVRTLDRHTLPIQTMAWSGSRLITGDQGGNLAFWDPHHDQPIAFIPWTENRISALAATRDRLVVGSTDGRVYLWGEP